LEAGSIIDQCSNSSILQAHIRLSVGQRSVELVQDVKGETWSVVGI